MSKFTLCDLYHNVIFGWILSHVRKISHLLIFLPQIPFDYEQNLVWCNKWPNHSGIKKKKSYFNKRFFKLNLLVLFSQKWIIWKAFMDWPYFQIYIYKNYETTHTKKKRKIAIDSMLNFNYFSFTNFYEFIYFYFLSK